MPVFGETTGVELRLVAVKPGRCVMSTLRDVASDGVNRVRLCRKKIFERMPLCGFRRRPDNHAHERWVCAHVETRVDNTKVGTVVLIDGTHEHNRFKARKAVNKRNPLTFVQRLKCLLIDHD